MRRLLFDLSSHGYGHLSQMAPIIEACFARLGGCEIVVRTALDESVCRERIAVPFRYVTSDDDIGLVNIDALRVDAVASFEYYCRMHATLDECIERNAAQLHDLRPDIVVSDVGYLGVAAAHQLGVPAVAVSSINWADTFLAYCGDSAGANSIAAQMTDCYRLAEVFVQLTPHMLMPGMSNTSVVDPVYRVAEQRRGEIDAKLGLKPNDRLVLVGFGGVSTPLDLARWPTYADVHWLVPDYVDTDRVDATLFSTLDMPFSALMASCDVVVTKPGYNTFVEAAAVSAGVLYVPRGDWPEEPALTEWLHRHTRARAITQAELKTGQFCETLRALLDDAAEPLSIPNGVVSVVDRISACLEERSRAVD